MNPIYRFFLGYSGNLAGKQWPDEKPGTAINADGTFTPDENSYTSGKVTLPPGTDTVELLYMQSGVAAVAAYGGTGGMLSVSEGLGTGAHFPVPSGTAYIRYSVPGGSKDTAELCAGHYAKPVYKDDLAVQYALETGQLFYRPKLSGSLTFTACDYSAIDTAAFDTTFILDIDTSTDGGNTWRRVYDGQFHKTDCEFDYADSRAEAEIEARDRYSKVVDGLENEFRLVKLPIAVRRMVMQKRPMVQVYVPGDSIVSCFLGNLHWEQDATATDDATALGNYHFDCPNVMMVVKLSSLGDGRVGEGVYAGDISNAEPGPSDDWTATLYSTDGLYRMTYSSSFYQGQHNATIRLFDTSSNERVAEYFVRDGAIPPNPGYYFENIALSPAGNAEIRTFGVYARLVCDVTAIDGKATYPVSADDIVADNKHYRYAIGYGLHNVYLSTNFSDEPTEWGMNDEGRYFLPPYVPGMDFLPVAQSTWGDYSLWYNPVFDSVFEKEGRKDYVLNDSYLVADVIAALLKEIDPTVTHAATAEYSQYFYGGSTDGGRLQQLLMTQKTNITNGEYTQPAQNTPITLKTLLDMYKNVFKCYWFIEGGKLKIEQVEFFRNGGTYDSTGTIGYDLTKTTLPRSGKAWAYGMEPYQFEKPDMAERYVFSWMDETTEPFSGMPLEVLSPYVSKGKKEEINISNFTSDIDFMLLEPEAISDDGYALFFAVPGEAVDTSGGIFDYVTTSGTDGITEPRLPVRTLFQGQAATLEVEATGGGTAGLVFFDSSGGLIAGSYPTITADGSRLTLDLQIPQGAAAMAFLAEGTVTAKVYGLLSYGLPQLPYIDVTMDGVQYNLQNGLLSFAHLQAAYWRYDMPAPRLKINGSEYSALSIERKKTQQATYPATLPYDPVLLVRTPVGDGQVKEASVSLSSLTAKTTLIYDTE